MKRRRIIRPKVQQWPPIMQRMGHRCPILYQRIIEKLRKQLRREWLIWLHNSIKEDMEEEVISQEEIIEAIQTISEVTVVEVSTQIIAEEEASKITEVKEEVLILEKDKIAEMMRAIAMSKVS